MLHSARFDKPAAQAVDMQAGPAERIADKQAAGMQAARAVLTARAADKPAVDKPAVLQVQRAEPAELTVRVLREQQVQRAVQH